MQRTLTRRAGMVAGLVFGLVVICGAVLLAAPSMPVAAAQGTEEAEAPDAPAAESTATPDAPAIDGTPTDEVPSIDGTPAPAAPPADASPMPLAETDDSIPVPPTVAAGIFANDLKGDAVFRSGICPTGDADGLNVGEGFRLRVRGRCAASQDVASIAVPGNGVSLMDGDVALDFKVVASAERVGLNLYVRNRDGKLLATYLNFRSGEASLYRREGTTNTTLATAGGLNDLVTPTDWTRLALRVRGGEVWLLINDEPLLYAADVLNQPGGIGVGVVREGNPDDAAEAAVVFRDLTVSAVEPAE